MDLQLKYQLAGRELRRLAAVACDLEMQIPTALAMLELVDIFLQSCYKQRHAGSLDTIKAFRQTVSDSLAGMALESTLRRGEILKAAFQFPRANCAAVYAVYNACLLGSHTLGRMTAGGWAVRVEVNRFAATIAGNFPTLAELLIEAQNGDARTESPDPANFARDGSPKLFSKTPRGRAAEE